MPRFDQTGPMGQGAMTGRRMGRCMQQGTNPTVTDLSASDNHSSANNFVSRGMGMGRGMSGSGCGKGGNSGMRCRGGFGGGNRWNG